ncbi:PREDICTED: receptor-like serine/threonine-protein kinase ALE2 isoform X2 [Ipomoea nil]|uniref:receptor-like serine/threonine-protein kinase ALE2 isoform X2 n=1 Tax=Ipomoea nil TaxID=35883 RepID=UPI000900EB5B|nr:PREDICTED: receptor-like serine/threonine-protein kinase ALE2 isoform X2 [Ipomoea nil]
MVAHHRFMMLKFCLVLLTAFSVPESAAGFDLLSWKVGSVFHHFKEAINEAGYHVTGGSRLVLLQDVPASSPTSIPPIEGPSAPSKPAFVRHGKNQMDGSATFPPVSSHESHQTRNKLNSYAPEPSWQEHWPSISPSQSPSSLDWGSATAPSSHFTVPAPQPAPSPTSPLRMNEITPPPFPVLALPPPPPNQDCAPLRCTEPLTYMPPGSPCGCVLPIKVALRFSITLYAFFPLVSELSKEIASSISLNQSQVHIKGANTVNQQLEKTIVLINLVPADEKFSASAAFAIYDKFWKREVSLENSKFGSYEVAYVLYPGLPPSPPALPSSGVSVDDLPYPTNDNNGRTIKPLGVDVPRIGKNGIGKNMIIVIVLSSVTAFVVCIGVIWILWLKYGCCTYRPVQTPHVLISSQGKTSGAAGSMLFGSKTGSRSISFSSSLRAYAGTAKIFSTSDIERATDNFKASRILGEGGFGLVYSGVLDDGRKVAVKILKRDDRQGSRELLAEVEMLSRLHHRNLVKLIGLCPEEHCHCLVYELVPNGSVESHLHGVDKEASPLDWYARMKIALGAARGLAYLHEDSSPRVIHRDFKASNILLEHDFTPKVSDFGLARAAMDEGNRHISTHVMGTFGYVAPEYAMTGHLLVKSDVYSYGVVLLELLTGRKPVDLSQPEGQENLVAWARPLLTTKEGLEMLIDPTISSDIPFDSFIKFAAIASMCVQPEVSHRPFMGEVVQALKLICNEFDETKEPVSRSCSHEDFSGYIGSKHGRQSGDFVEASQFYDPTFAAKVSLSASDLKSASTRLELAESESFRRQFNSAPLKMGRKRNFWQRLRSLSSGSMSEHSFSSVL